jgi:hypothetical protein
MHPPQFIYLGNTHQCAVNLNAPRNSAQCPVDALAADSMISEKAARVRDGRVDGGIPCGRRTGLAASRVVNDRSTNRGGEYDYYLVAHTRRFKAITTVH